MTVVLPIARESTNHCYGVQSKCFPIWQKYAWDTLLQYPSHTQCCRCKKETILILSFRWMC